MGKEPLKKNGEVILAGKKKKEGEIRENWKGQTEKREERVRSEITEGAEEGEIRFP